MYCFIKLSLNMYFYNLYRNSEKEGNLFQLNVEFVTIMLK